jgi:hypothetical protein
MVYKRPIMSFFAVQTIRIHGTSAVRQVRGRQVRNRAQSHTSGHLKTWIKTSKSASSQSDSWTTQAQKREETYAGSRRSGDGFGFSMGQRGCVFCRPSCIRAQSPTSTHLGYSIPCHKLPRSAIIDYLGILSKLLLLSLNLSAPKCTSPTSTQRLQHLFLFFTWRYLQICLEGFCLALLLQ